MRRWLMVGAGAAALVAGGCSLGASDTPTILVDFSHDEFASQFIAYFPSEVRVHPGDTVTFRQTWTGEPHTVTFGKDFSDVLNITQPLLEEFGDVPESEVPPEAMGAFMGAMQQLPMVEDEDGQTLQSIAQPCLLTDGDLPADGAPCEVRDLPAFTGTEMLYNSGVIPFEGKGNNRFDLVLADDIAPGTYPFLCAIHGPFQSGVIEVVAEDEPADTPREVSARARAEIDEAAGPMREYFTRAREEGVLVLAGKRHEAYFAGLLTESVGIMSGQINEFVPEEVSVEVDEPVTWRMFGGHSIAFDVPEYFPIVEFADDGTVSYNEAVHEPAGSAPPLPEDEEEDGPPQVTGPSEPLIWDGGTWDGDGFYSSGTLWSEEYTEFTLRFSQPGTYRYACLIHPPMVGTVKVTGKS